MIQQLAYCLKKTPGSNISGTQSTDEWEAKQNGELQANAGG